MNQFFVCLLAGIAVVALRAGPVETSIVAAMRLSEQPNYTWISTIEDDARSYEISGKTVRGGVTLVKMPMVNAVRQRLGRAVNDTEIEAIFRGNQRFVLRTDDGWKTLDELPRPSTRDAKASRMPAPPRVYTGMGIMGGTPTQLSITGSALPSSARRVHRHGANRPGMPYSNLQLGVSHPHEDLGVIVGSHAEWKVDGDIVSGTLTDLGAQLLLVRDGHEEITPLGAAGTFKLWIRNGIVTRYQLRLEGLLSVSSRYGDSQVEVHQTSDTVLKEIGTTGFEVPAEARLKLGR
ncbi:MAG: hypothetical protein Q7S40_12425 [Opitutaceae bacterium]|nr:hypothetical protein [Opitutaceae bacterium]